MVVDKGFQTETNARYGKNKDSWNLGNKCQSISDKIYP